MTRFKAWLIKKRFMRSERCRVFTYRFDGRKYITDDALQSMAHQKALHAVGAVQGIHVQI
nr:MAG TPA_asm: hypothetical protein [Caudoviricetes sp.]